MRLNYDILISVMSFLKSRTDLRRMMSTCRMLNKAGVPHILDGQTWVGSPQKFLALCLFLYREPAYRFRHLRHLTLPYFSAVQVPVASSQLVQFFRHAQYLETLKLYYPGLFCLSCDEQVNSAISALASLRNISLFPISIESSAILRELQSPLRTLKISCGDLDTYLSDLSPTLARFKDSLEELDIDHTRLPTPDVQYPRLITLRVELSTPRTVVLRRMCTLFPNLRNLAIRRILGSEPDSVLEELRGENLPGPTTSRRLGVAAIFPWSDPRYLYPCGTNQSRVSERMRREP